MENTQQLFIDDAVKRKEGDMLGYIREKNVDNLFEVHWFDDSSSLEHNDDLIICDRSFDDQDRVVSAFEPTGQTGYVSKIHVYVDLLGDDKTVTKGVSTRDLRRVRDLAFGVFVVLGPWLGCVTDVWDDVTLLVNDYDHVVARKIGYGDLKGVHISGFDDVLRPHYPGQIIDMGASRMSNDALAAYGPETSATVTRVSQCEVLIEWIASQQPSSSKPKDVQLPSVLKSLNTFSHEEWGLGDRCHLPSQFDADSRLVENERALRIVNMWVLIDVLWQDGSVERGRVSSSLLRKIDPGEYEFLPNEYVTYEYATENSLDDGSERVGVIKSVNSNDRIALVKWLIPRLEDEAVNVSVYELKMYSGHQLNIGNFVRKLSDLWFNRAEDDFEDTNFVDPAWIGQVTGYRNGDIEVHWIDGTISLVGLRDVYYIPTPRDRLVPDGNEAGDHIGAIEADNISVLDPISDDDLASSAIEAGDNVSVFDPMADDEVATIENIIDDVSGFKLFDASTDPSDDHYFRKSHMGKGDKKWLKKIQQEWKILQNNLPNEIYTRIYEDRMDLLRVLIIGPCGTPYHDGLFFFDLHLPPNYPSVPPCVNYHSGGLQINANLNKDGSVCLSLLNTWHGNGNEVWKAESSTILQVLVSLQALVLNAKPYFNEAGYDSKIGTAEGEKNSLAYNENTFLMSCRRMMNLIRAPPKGFEELVKEHFKRRGYFILKACDAYKKGILVGSLSKDASTSDNINPV